MRDICWRQIFCIEKYEILLCKITIHTQSSLILFVREFLIIVFEAVNDSHRSKVLDSRKRYKYKKND